MRFGVKLPHSGPLASLSAVRAVAIEAERLNFDSVWVHDHISYGKNWIGHRASGLMEQMTPDYEPQLFEAVTTLAYVAGVTTRSASAHPSLSCRYEIPWCWGEN